MSSVRYAQEKLAVKLRPLSLLREIASLRRILFFAFPRLARRSLAAAACLGVVMSWKVHQKPLRSEWPGKDKGRAGHENQRPSTLSRKKT